MGTQLNSSSSDSRSSESPDMQRQPRQVRQQQRQGQQGDHQQEQGQQQGQQQSVLQRMSAAFGLGRLPRRQASDGMSGSGGSGSRMQTQLSPVYSLGDEADEAVAVTEGTELLHECA